MTDVSLPAQGIQFLRDLAANNNRDWFQANKSRFEADAKRPAALLAEALAHDLSRRLDFPLEAKLFRIYRDVRFSKDKTPYNTHLRFAFWPRGGTTKAPMAGPAFYLSVEPEEVIAGAGAISFSPTGLERFRASITEGAAEPLADLLAGLTASGLRLDPPELKRLPRGYSAKTEAEETLLRRKGLAVWHHRTLGTPPEDITARQCMDSMLKALPLVNWLQDTVFGDR